MAACWYLKVGSGMKSVIKLYCASLKLHLIAKLFFVSPKELPWDQPSIGCKEYIAWKDNRYALITPWSKLETLTLSFIRKILVPNPEKRLTLDKIKQHKWCQSHTATTGNGVSCVINGRLFLHGNGQKGETKAIESFSENYFSITSRATFVIPSQPTPHDFP